MDGVKDIKLREGLTVSDLMKQFKDVGGFTAKKLAVASGILKEMQNDEGCFNFLSFPACIIATGFGGL